MYLVPPKSRKDPMQSVIPSKLRHPPLSVFKRRKKGSELDEAASTVAHAINYLLSEHTAGRVQANRDAISQLCEAYEKLAAAEHYQPTSNSVMNRLLWFREGQQLFKRKR